MRGFVCGFIAGTWWLQQQAEIPRYTPLLFILFVIAAFLLFSYRVYFPPKKRIPPILVVLGLIVCGMGSAYYAAAWRAQLRLADRLNPVLEQKDVQITGVVVSLPARSESSTRFEFEVEEARYQDQSVNLPTRIALSWYSNKAKADDIRPGQRWRLSVRLKRPHGNANPFNFDYEYYLIEQDIGATGYVRFDSDITKNQILVAFVLRWDTLLEAMRYRLREVIENALPDRPFTGVIIALVLGEQHAITQTQWQLFSQTGISHLVSISGLHVTLVAGIFAWMGAWLWRRHSHLPLYLPAQKFAVLIAVFAALGYCLLAGWGVPAQRTFIMLCVVAVALWLDRLMASSVILALAAWAVLVLDPWAVMAPGFWLSFAAVAFIMLAMRRPPLQQPIRGWREKLKQVVKIQGAITLGLAPLTLLLFQQISLIGPIANAIAIPVVSFLITPLALIGTGVALFAPLPQLLQLAHDLFNELSRVLGWLVQWPFSVWTAPVPPLWAFFLAVCAGIFVITFSHVPKRWRLVICLLSWTPLFLIRAQSPSLGAVAVTAFDVGQGMALLIETAQHRLLYDTGPQFNSDSDSGNRVLVPYLRGRGINQLDILVVSHQDTDHAGGALSILRSLQVGKTLASLPLSHPIVPASKQFEQCQEGQQWQWDQVYFRVLHPDAVTPKSSKLKPNAHSCVIQISSAGQSILLSGDIESAQEQRLLKEYGAQLQSTVLLVPHHGSGTSSTRSFLNAVNPKIALFQVGYLNRYHHPKTEVWQRYNDLNIQRERTDDTGAMLISWSATQSMQLSRYRQQHPRYWYPERKGSIEGAAKDQLQ